MPLNYDADKLMIPPLRELMGPSGAIRRVIAEVRRVASSDFNVLILGETGTGKELIARAIHHISPRGSKPFVAVDCGAIPDTLLESELFGHEKGAFTGAEQRRTGKIELGEGGTLLLDEIGNLALSSQAKLLRLLQDRIFSRVGSNDPIKMDARVVAATNRDLLVSVAEGTFREDLLYRLNEFVIHIPPLRERGEDILYLANKFLDITNMELKKSVHGFSDDAQGALLSSDWPGNVRQLQSAVRRAVLLAESIITPEHLRMQPSALKNGGNGAQAAGHAVLPHTEGLSLREIASQAAAAAEKAAIVDALRKTAGNKARAARLLQTDYKTLYLKIKKYDLTTQFDDPWYR
jgi:two-component system nitrogen regulation response regulator GlnG